MEVMVWWVNSTRTITQTLALMRVHGIIKFMDKQRLEGHGN